MRRQEVARVGNGKVTHGIKGGEWSSTRVNHTVCGRQATAVEHSGAGIEITCKACLKGMDRELIIQTDREDVSYRDELGNWLDGDRRILHEYPTESYALDSDDLELNDNDPVAAAIWRIQRDNPGHYDVSSTPVQGSENEWLSYSYKDPYSDCESEYSIRLRGDWTQDERMRVFLGINN